MNMIAMFVVVGFAGMYAHYLKRALREQTDLSLVHYIMSNKRATGSAVISMVVAVVGLISTGQVEVTTQTLALAFFAGYGADSAVNKE
jgi:hypothetical protein